VPFRVEPQTLERLDWPRVLARLADHARTPRGRARLAPPDGEGALFEDTAEGVRARIAETREARDLRREGASLPVGELVDPSEALGRATRGGILTPRALLDLRGVIQALAETLRLLSARADAAPRLATLAATLDGDASLALAIERMLDPAGEVRDEASPALAEARRELRRLSSTIEAALEKLLRDPDLRERLSDAYFTVRGDRYVLPVRADARSSVPGIVHDASRSGTTLFVEPQALVELNNRHKQAELFIAAEIQRVLRELSRRAAERGPIIEADLDTLGHLDLAFARAALADEMEACEPTVGDDGILRLPALRHPAIPPEEVVPNDVELGHGPCILVLSGPNAGGKTVAMKAVALSVLLVRAGLFVPAAPGARVDLFDEVRADIGDGQDIREHLSTFSAHMASLARTVREASSRSLVVLDEIGVGTDPGEGAALAQAVLEELADTGARVVATTHFNLLKEMAEVDPRFANASVELDPETLAPTYRLRMGLAGASSATAVAARMGMPAAVLDRANELLGHEDRRLDHMLSELSASRAALEREQREARRLRDESLAVREEYRERVLRMRARRDELYRAMRSDLDHAFREAHGRVAGVIRDLQRSGTARDAARARERLLELESEVREGAMAAPGPEPGADGLAADAPEASASAGEPIDWRFARAGDAVALREGGSATLLALPDRRGRAALRIGSARVLVPAERVVALRSRPPAPAPRVAVEPAGADALAGGTHRCDLRGLRVDEAVERLATEIDRALATGCARLEVVHGVGTGTLRRVVREQLAASPFVRRVFDAQPEGGGDGVTLAAL